MICLLLQLLTGHDSVLLPLSELINKKGGSQTAVLRESLQAVGYSARFYVHGQDGGRIQHALSIEEMQTLYERERMHQQCSCTYF